MIPLTLRAEVSRLCGPFVMRMNGDWNPTLTEFDAYVIGNTPDHIIFHSIHGEISIRGTGWEELERDVLFVNPLRKTATRLIRASSSQNTLLITEQCDQLCRMCSQPPKAHHYDLFNYYELAILLAPQDATIGLSGGEPTLYKGALFDLILRSLEIRPDIRFHVLTNGQHFSTDDLKSLMKIPKDRVLWGIPLYSSSPSKHDFIVGKVGAFDRLQQSLLVLLEAGAEIELRTVVANCNVGELAALAEHIAIRLPFVVRWAIMQLERIGFGRKNWNELFFDNSVEFSQIAEALDVAQSAGLNAELFNFPLCTIPSSYRRFNRSTISDWKRKYVDVCNGCQDRHTCGGFFEWYTAKEGFSRLGLLPS